MRDRVTPRIIFQEIDFSRTFTALDIISLHPYGLSNESPDIYLPFDNHTTFRDVETLKQIMERNGQSNKEIWITEFGWQVGSSLGGISLTEELQAINMMRSIGIVSDEWPYVSVTIPDSCIKQTRREHFQSLVMRVLLELNGLLRTSPSVKSRKVDELWCFAFKRFRYKAFPLFPPSLHLTFIATLRYMVLGFRSTYTSIRC